MWVCAGVRQTLAQTHLRSERARWEGWRLEKTGVSFLYLILSGCILRHMGPNQQTEVRAVHEQQVRSFPPRPNASAAFLHLAPGPIQTGTRFYAFSLPLLLLSHGLEVVHAKVQFVV